MTKYSWIFCILLLSGLAFFSLGKREAGSAISLRAGKHAVIKEGMERPPNKEELHVKKVRNVQPRRRAFKGALGTGHKKGGDFIYRETGIETSTEEFMAYREGDQFHWEVVKGFRFSGKVFTYAQKTPRSVGFSVLLDDGEGRLVYARNERGTEITVYYTGESLMHIFQHVDGEWTAIETTLASNLCADLGATYPVVTNFKAQVKKARLGGASNGIATPPLTGYTGNTAFQSKPGSNFVIYLDFDGETNLAIPEWADPTATPPVPGVINVSPAGLSDAFIHYVMCGVAEDFSPFDVNVTNVRAVYDATPTNQRTMCITTTDTLLTDGGGVATGRGFLNDFVSWNSFTEVPSDCSDTISHEVGHDLGLDHDGSGPVVPYTNPTVPAQPSTIVEYYPGHINGKESWAPIMGSGLGFSLSQWSKLEYRNARQYEKYFYDDGNQYYASYDATEEEDDFVIVTENGLPLMTDDHGDNFSNTTDFTVGETPYTVTGIIGANNDVDAFKMTFTGLGIVNFFSGSAEVTSNLDVRMKIYDASQTVLLDYTSEDYRTAHYQTELQPGVYYITLEGDGAGDPNATTPTGYTKYGSVGQYDLTVTPYPKGDSQGVELQADLTLPASPVPWQVQSQIAHDGVDALQAGRVAHDQSASFSFTSSTDSISFWYKVSSEFDADRLVFFIDGIEEQAWSGEEDWTQYTKTGLTAGAHTFTFTYSCDDETTEGFNAAWIDQVEVDDQESLDQWLTQNGLNSSGEGSKDNDGYPDLMEYVAGSDPSLTSSVPYYCLNAQTGALEFTRNTARKGTVTRLLLSNDLTNWNVVAVSYNGEAFYMRSGVTGLSESGSSTSSQVTFPLNNGSSRQFGRFQFQALPE